MRYASLYEVQKNELEVLKVFDNLCRKIGVKYTLSGGTLLGAVRHKGFIPWDDDIDVAMRRSDYEIFERKCEKYLPDNYFFQTYKTDSSYPISFGKLRNQGIQMYVRETSHLDIKQGVCIDVFPIDKCADNLLLDFIDRARLSVITFLKYSVIEENNNTIGIRSILRKMAKIFVKHIGTASLNDCELLIKNKRNAKNNYYVYCDYIIPAYKLKKRHRLPSYVFDEYSEIEFEGLKFSVILDFDIYLKAQYGDYMKLPPKKERVPMHNFIIDE